jgi:hypothetical protein
MSTCRLQPVFSKTPRTCVRIVFTDVPPSLAMSSTVLPEARLRATRARLGGRQIDSGRSGCRVGLTPTGKRRLSTAHTPERTPSVRGSTSKIEPCKTVTVSVG